MNTWRQPSLGARLVIQGGVWLLAATMLLPFAWMVSTSLKTRQQAGSHEASLLPPGALQDWQWSNYIDAWEVAQLGDYYANSLAVACITTVLAGVHNALAGYAFAKLRFRGRRALFLLVVASMMLPMQASFIFTYIICGWLGYIDSWPALIVPFLAGAFGVFYMHQAVATVPDDLLHAGRIDGLTEFDLFLHVVIPCVRQGVGALAIFTFMASWNSFFWPLIVIDSNENYTLPLAIKALSGQYYTDSWPVQMAAATIICLPVVIVFIAFSRLFTRGMTLSGLKG